MRVLKVGLAAPAVTRWQEFLHGMKTGQGDEVFYSGPIDGVFDRGVRLATRNYQMWLIEQDRLKDRVPAAAPVTFRLDRDTGHERTFRVKPTGVVDAATVMAAQLHGFVPEPQVEMGPDILECDDLLSSRPYFLVPLPEPPIESAPCMGAVAAAAEEVKSDQSGERAAVRSRIGKWLRAVYPAPTEAEPRVTDLYIFSHGWHRNFYQAVSAYDRLSGRIARLARSGRFDAPDMKPSAGENFRPLFLNLHWHSDPGEDDFVDNSGRRDKTSFMQSISLAFEPKSTQAGAADAAIQMTVDFEDMFAVLSRMAAPDTHSLSDDAIMDASKSLFIQLDLYQLKGVPDPTGPAAVAANRPAKCAILWTCYHEADSRKVLLDQNQPPNDFVGTPGAVVTFIKFALGLAGAAIVAALGGKIGSWLQWPPLNATGWWQLALCLAPIVCFWLVTGVTYRNSEIPGQSLDAGEAEPPPVRGFHRITRWVRPYWTAVEFGVLTVLCLAFVKIVTELPVKVWGWLHRAGPSDVAARHLADKAAALVRYSAQLAGWLSLIAILCWIVLWALGRIRASAQGKSRQPNLDFALLFWLPFEVTIALPVASYLLLTYFFGKWCSQLPFVANLFDERVGARNDITQVVHDSDFRDRLAIAARLPLGLARGLLSPDSFAVAPLDTFDGLLSFYEMQRKGVAAGDAAAGFMRRLFAEVTDLQHPKMRIHMVGHSFGALVVTNLARSLALLKPADGPGKLHTLCTLEGAIGSDWYQDETTLRSYMSGSIAAVFSRYDTANGVYYPLASNARLAAGNVGMTSEEGRLVALRDHFVLLVQPPKLGERQYLPTPPTKPNSDDFHWLNLDASRIIYNGSPASGGGHTDIFKDDVVHLLWSVTRQFPIVP